MVAPGKGSRFLITPKLFHLVFLPLLLCLLGCNKNKDYTQIDDEIIQQYISETVSMQHLRAQDCTMSLKP